MIWWLNGYERTATLITSNLDFGEWGDAFPNQLLGAATLDRLRHGAYHVVILPAYSGHVVKRLVVPQTLPG